MLLNERRRRDHQAHELGLLAVSFFEMENTKPFGDLSVLSSLIPPRAPLRFFLFKRLRFLTPLFQHGLGQSTRPTICSERPTNGAVQSLTPLRRRRLQQKSTKYKNRGYRWHTKHNMRLLGSQPRCQALSLHHCISLVVGIIRRRACLTCHPTANRS